MPPCEQEFCEVAADAAHSAGFADLAHMSRTFRNTFGVVPSELQKMAIAFKQEEK